MTLLNHALSAGGRTAPRGLDAAPTALIAGGGGALGSAVLERLLASRRFAPVRVLATRGLTTAMQGLEPVIVESFAERPATGAPPIAQTALVVFDRERHANGRELAFLRPRPEDLAVLAGWLRQRGVQQLVVVLPHSPSGLPDALKAGLANLDEQAVAALGFEHLVFVRAAQAPSTVRARQWLQRIADGMLAQMQMMVAAPNQPVRAQKVAQFAVELAMQLPASEAGARIAPPELVWQAAQLRDPSALVQAWLAARELPAIAAPRMRL